MTKKLFLLLVLMLLFSCFAFAGGSFENAILYQPTNVPNNQGVMIELSQQKSENISTFTQNTNISTIYKSSFPSNLPLFFVAGTLDSSEDGNSDNIDMTIRSPYMDGFYFVKDGNETKKVPFTLDAFIIAYTGSVDRAGQVSWTNNKQQRLINTLALEEGKSASFSSITTASGMTYTLSVPSTSHLKGSVWLIFWTVDYDYPKYPRFYYISANIPGANNLEDGEYTATLYLTCDRMGLSDTEITVKGYVGEKPVDIQSNDYSFFVNNGSDTYFANLEVLKDDENPPSFDVASLQFYFTAPYSTRQKPTKDDREGKFRIYISPTSTYSTDGKYTFKRTGTENQDDSFGNRIYYELDTTNTTGLTKLYPNNAANNTYYLITDYSNLMTKDGGLLGGDDVYQETWKLEDKHIYIQIAEESKEVPNPPEGQEPKVHQTGTYYSYMYFTVESTF